MSSYLVLEAAGRALRELLRDEFSNEPRLASYVATVDGISLKTPTEVIRTGKGQLSLWLYTLSENEFLRNSPPGSQPERRFPALPLNLHFMVTPLTTNGEADLMVMGKAMQVFHDNPVIVLSSPQDDIHERLTIELERLTLDEQSRIWEALSEPYRLSVSYQVQVARIDAEDIPADAPVIGRLFDHGPGVGLEASA